MSGNSDIMHRVIDTINSKYKFSDEKTTSRLAAKLLPYAKKMHLNKGDILLNIGEIPSKIIFVSSGLLRKCYFDHKNSLKTHVFLLENTLFSEGIMLGKDPSKYIIDTLEDTEIFYIHIDDFESFLYDDLDIMKAYIKFSEYEWIEIITEGLRFSVNAVYRYKHFIEKYPSIETRISQQDIANYLGITPVSLSRIRKQIAEEVNLS